MTDLADMRTAGPAIGRAVLRREDERMLQGRGRYLDDLSRSNMLHAAIVRSAVAHGTIRAIDTTRALGMPGVVAVFSAADIGASIPRIPMRQEARPELAPYEQPVIAQERVRYVGEPIAVVIAATPAQAEDALDAVVVDIEPMPVVASREAAARDDVLLHPSTGSNCAITLSAVLGDADAAFRDAPYTRRERFAVQRQSGAPIETRGLLAAWDARQQRLTIEGATKVPYANRRILARLLDLPESSIEQIEHDVGGGFGVRGEFYPEDFLIPFAARRLGCPVKWVEDRREHFLATNHARDAECELEIACTREGTILALRGHARTDVGAYLRTVGITPSRNIAQVSPGPYRIPHLRMDVAVLMTNKTPVATYRAPGRFETDFFRERLLDLVAADLGIDRVELRRRNLVKAQEIPYPLPTVLPFGEQSSFDSGDFAQTLERCLAEFDWPSKSHLNGKLLDGRYHGVALGCYIEGGASGPRESARLVVEADGRVCVHTGSSAVGQGLETTFAQIAADALGFPLERIGAVVHGSTTTVREGFGTYSSRATVMGGSAIVLAARQLLESIRAAAASKLGCAPEVIAIVDGAQVVGAAGRTIELAALAAEQALTAEASFDSRKRTYSYGTHAAHVAVDPNTGQVDLLDYVAVEDVGRVINPLTLHGQTIGAIVQGLGGVLLEALAYDEQGQLTTASFADYLLPTAPDCANLRAVVLEEHPSPNNPLGAKGAGEGGIIPVGGVMANAIAAALAPLGVKIFELPLSPSRLWHLIDAAGKPTQTRGS